MDGFRKTLVEEFNSIYVFNLRGNQRTQGEQSRKEGGKIFGSGSRTPVAITILVKNPASSEHGVIRYHDIGDYLTREEKLSIVASAVSGEPFEWDFIEPDRHGDWLNQRDDSWYDFMPLGLSKYKAPSGLFTTWSLGIATNRDAWMTNYSETQVLSNMKRFQEFYEEQVISYQTTGVLDMDKKKISWTDKLQEMAKKVRRCSNPSKPALFTIGHSISSLRIWPIPLLSIGHISSLSCFRTTGSQTLLLSLRREAHLSRMYTPISS